jgi:hypothetical protein
MNLLEETIDATLDSSGGLRLSQQPQLPPGPVRITIRVAGKTPRRSLADVVQEIADGQRLRGFPGMTAEELLAFDQQRAAESLARDHELDAARRSAPGVP